MTTERWEDALLGPAKDPELCTVYGCTEKATQTDRQDVTRYPNPKPYRCDTHADPRWHEPATEDDPGEPDADVIQAAERRFGA